MVDLSDARIERTGANLARSTYRFSAANRCSSTSEESISGALDLSVWKSVLILKLN